MEIIAFINQKGGVGKTTSTANIGSGLAILGKRVLMIDLDPQSHLAHSLGVPVHEVEHSIYDVLRGDVDPKQAFIRRDVGAKINRLRDGDGDGPRTESENLFFTIIPSSIRLSGIDMEFAMVPRREFLLKSALGTIAGEFDYILIDCPPSLGLLTINALTAARRVNIPVQAEYLALESLGKLTGAIDRIKRDFNETLEIGGIIATRFDGRRLINREVVSRLHDQFGGLLFNTVIRENIAIAEAPSRGVDIFTYRPTSYGATDYLRLSEEVLDRSRNNNNLNVTSPNGSVDLNMQQ
jgi:chromosome partitioning protein